MRRLNISFLIKKQRKNVLIGQKIRENSASFFVKTWRELNSYLVKLQLYICGIWKSWVPSWNRTNLLSRQSETLLIMISFNFSQIKALGNLCSVNFSLTYLSYVRPTFWMARKNLVKSLMYKDSKISYERFMAPMWNRTNLLSRKSETLLIMISFNFSQKGSRLGRYLKRLIKSKWP